MLKLPSGITRADEKLVLKLIDLGILYVDETGVHVSEKDIEH